MPARVRVRSSLRYVSDHGAMPTVIGWPFAWIEFSSEAIDIFDGRLVPAWIPPHGRPKIHVERSSITKIERTQNGIRIFASGFDDPWVVASLFPKSFLRKLRKHGLNIPSGPIVRSTWNTL